MNKKRKKIGLVLGSGGARGLAHLGVLKVLEKENIKIDYLVGVSMGSLIAAYYALGLNLEKLEAEAIKMTRTRAIRKLLDLSDPRKSIIRGQKIKKYIEELIGDSSFSDIKIPLQIIATNLSNGAEVILSQGNLIQAIQASISVPGILAPVKINNKYLVDGGVIDPTPIDIPKRMGADIIIGVDLTIQRNIKFTKDPSLIMTLMQSYDIIRTQAVQFNINKVRDNKKNIILIKPEPRSTIDSFKFHKIREFIKAGEKEAYKNLSKIKKLINS